MRIEQDFNKLYNIEFNINKFIKSVLLINKKFGIWVIVNSRQYLITKAKKL